MPALAQVQDDAADTDPVALLDQAEKALATVQKQLDDTDDQDALRGLGDTVLAAQRDAESVERSLTPERDQLDARLAQLGAAADGTTEARELTTRRAELNKQRSEVDAQIKRAGLLKVEAQQLNATIEREFGQRLGAQLSRRYSSPLAASTWRQVGQQFPDDLQRLRALYGVVADGIRSGVAKDGWMLPLAELVAAALLLWPLNQLLRWLGRRYAASRNAPGSRLRRSGLALWQLLVRTLMPGLAAALVVQALLGIGALPPRLELLAGNFVLISVLSALISAVSASLLMPNQPSWRLLPIDDATAVRLRRYARATALLAWISGLVLLINRAGRTSASTTLVVEGAVALAFALLVMAMIASLLRLHRPPAQDAPAAEGEPAPAPQRRSSVVVLVALVVNLVVAVALVAVLAGYVDFALFATRQVIWVAVVLGALAVLTMFADDFSRWLFAPDSRFGRAANSALGLRPSHMEQAGVLLSAVLRIMLLVFGLSAVLQPFGSNFSTLFGWMDIANNGLEIGKLKLMPGDLLRALIVLAVGLGLMQVIQRWLVDTYLPKTELDASSKSSIATVARYLGIALVALWTLTALGLGLEKLALMVSALSVGIGFGLQAITQNFVSGLILMAERPVKIGDWIKIGDQEGDIRRISVRSTEIQVADKSTLIVPNSELITKTIRNMTMSSPLGRVQIQFSLPLGSDVGRVRELLLALYAEHPGVLDEPAPSVFIDSIAGGQVAINSFAYVSSPRNVYGVRSDLYFRLLEALAEEHIALATPQDIRIVGEVHQDRDGGGRE
ncbi:DUF3772 domain-containing protein [Stenotrophomonas sp. MMGLT7]|nr:DUF3772 domain-containing protein [Stenotrophomonas sp. MMGLT7]MCD7097995.1 DUF3772 domain-containing protein [Stenotrophomonas sp. MMGLT7]